MPQQLLFVCEKSMFFYIANLTFRNLLAWVWEAGHRATKTLILSQRKQCVSQMLLAVKNPPALQRRRFGPWTGKIPWRRNDSLLQCACLGNPWTEDHGRPQSVGLQIVRHDWAQTARGQKEHFPKSLPSRWGGRMGSSLALQEAPDPCPEPIQSPLYKNGVKKIRKCDISYISHQKIPFRMVD